ncbi:MAG: methionyl-tRNA formyltransferase [Candidatus Levyibacteriota bacterium]
MAVELKIGTPRADIIKSPEQKNPGLKLLFNGQGDGAAQVFKRLLEEGHEIVGVVTTKNEEDPLRKLALEHNLPIVNLARVNKEEEVERMKKWGADLGVGFYLQAQLNQGVYSIPEFGTMNFHLSPLPKRRGRDSMNWGILKGDKKLGASWFLMSKKIDAGPIARQITFKNNGKSQGAQYFEHLEEFVEHTVDAVNEMSEAIHKRRESGNKARLPLVPQIPKEVTEDPRLGLKHTRVRPNILTAETGYNRIQAGGPGAWIMQKEAKGRIFLSKPSLDTSGLVLVPGETAVIDKGLAIGMKRGVLIAGAVGKGPKDRLSPRDFIDQYGPIKF